jgi:hypothetical protein
MEELSNAEKLKLQREQRRERILAKGEQRLNKIVKSYSGESVKVPVQSNDKIDLETDRMSLNNQQQKPKSKENDAVKNQTKGPESNKEITQSNKEISGIPVEKLNSKEEKISSNEAISFKSDMLPEYSRVDSDLALPFEQVPVSNPQVELQSPNYISWFHSILFSSITIIAFIHWLMFHSHPYFKSDDPSTIKQMCRQLVYLKDWPAHSDFGASSKVIIMGYTMTAWKVFMTIEIGLLTVRLALLVVYN